MAVELATGYVSLLPSARGFGAAIESQVGGEVDAAGTSLGRRIGSRLGQAATAVAATLGTAVVAAGTVGLRTAAQLEQAEIGFTTMLGSGERAQSFLSSLATFAGRTPFGFTELQTAASSLISVGINADKVIPIMTSLGNATSGMGTGAEGVKRATVALQQMNAAGRITAEDLNQLRDAGVPVYDLLAAATGKSVEEVAKLAATGKLGRAELDALMSALETGKGLERFTGLMEAQSASLTGMWSTLKDTFSMGMAEAIQPLIPLIKDGLGGATSFVTANMPALQAGLAGVVTWITNLFATLQGGGSLSDALGVSPQLAGELSSVKDSAIELAPAIRAFLDQMPSLSDVVTVGATALSFLADNADLLVKAMPFIVAGLILMKSAQAAHNVAMLASIPLRAAEVASNFALAGANRALAVELATLNGVERASMLTRIQGAASSAAAAVAAGAHRVATIASAAAAKVAAGAQWLLNAALSANPIGLVIIAIAALVAAFVIAYQNSETFRAIVQGAWEGIKAAAEAVGRWFTTTLPAWWSSVVTSTRTKWAEVVAVFTGLRARIGDAVEAVWGVITGVFARTPLGMVVTNFGAIVDWFRGLPGRITSALGDLGSLLYNAGANIIDGLARGIRSAVSKATSAVSGVMSAVRDFLPFSPARRGPFSGRGWSGYSGQSVTADFAKGMLRNRDKLTAAAALTMGDAGALATFAGAGSLVAGGRGGAPAPGQQIIIEGNVGWMPDELAREIKNEQRDLNAKHELSSIVGGI